jgi:hypothetical protein
VPLQDVAVDEEHASPRERRQLGENRSADVAETNDPETRRARACEVDPEVM